MEIFEENPVAKRIIRAVAGTERKLLQGAQRRRKYITYICVCECVITNTHTRMYTQ